MRIADSWLRDMPQQFQGRHNIEVLVKAFSRQLQELDKAFQDINSMTSIDTAAGKNLDYVGTIIPLTRKEAGELAGIGVSEPVISDERYRLFLRYQLLKNTGECTYYDLIDGIELLWGYKGIHYMEDPEHPALIIFQTDRMNLDEEDLTEFHPELCIRPAGVGVMLRKHFGGSYEVPVRYSESIRFRTGFYPRFNLPPLCLDNTWVLDGSRSLDGYDSINTVDLHPVGMRFRSEVKVHDNTASRIRIPGRVQEKTRVSMGVRISEKAEQKTKTETHVRIRFSAACPITNKADVHQENFLDDAWMMDGSRALDSDTYPL